MLKPVRLLLPLLLIVAGLVLVVVALPGPARAAPPALPPRPTLTPIPPTAMPTLGPTPVPTVVPPTAPPDTPAPTPVPTVVPPTAPPPVLPETGVMRPAWLGLLLGVGLVTLGVGGLLVAGRRRPR